MILPDVPMADYVRDLFGRMDNGEPYPPSLSSHIAHTLLVKSPAHAAWDHPRLRAGWEPDDERAFDLGTALHSVLLEGRALTVLDVDDYRTKAAQAARDGVIKAGGIPALGWQADAVREMVYHARIKLAQCPDLTGGVNALDAEHTILWQERGTWLRCRPDWMRGDRSLIVSVKTTTNAEPEAFTRGPLLAHSYDLQAAFELAGVKAATGIDAHYVWLVIETEPPYACSLIGMSPEWYAFAQTKFRKAVNLWAVCLARGEWPGYDAHIHYMDLPPWAGAQFTERHGYDAAPPLDDGRPLAEQMFGGTQ